MFLQIVTNKITSSSNVIGPSRGGNLSDFREKEVKANYIAPNSTFLQNLMLKNVSKWSEKALLLILI